MEETLGTRTCLSCLRPIPGTFGSRRCRWCGTFRRITTASARSSARSSSRTLTAVPVITPVRKVGKPKLPKPLTPAPDWSALAAIAAGPATRLPPEAIPPVWHTYAAFASMSVGVLSWIYVLWRLA